MQPWASLLAEGVKPIELKGWSTKYRGELLIRASRNSSVRWERDDGKRVTLPTECLLFVGQLVDVRPMMPEDRLPAMSADLNEGFCWDIRFGYYVYPRAASGKLKLYETPGDHVERLHDDQVRRFHPILKPRMRHPFQAKIVRKKMLVLDSRTGEPQSYTLHDSTTPPVASVFLPLYGLVGGLRGGGTPITLRELADSVNAGACYQREEDLPLRQP